MTGSKLNVPATTSNGWAVSADGRIATKTLTTTGLQTFAPGNSSGAFWRQVIGIGTLPAGFSGNYIMLASRAGSPDDMARNVVGVHSATQIYMANLSSSSIGNTSTFWTNNITLIRID